MIITFSPKIALFRLKISINPKTFFTLLRRSAFFLVLLIAGMGAMPSASASVLSRAPNGFSLVGYWGFEDGKGTVATDASGRSHVGTLSSAGLWTTLGKRGGAVALNGTSDYVSIGNVADVNFDRTSSFTITAWIYRTGDSTYDAIFAKQAGSATYTGYQLALAPQSSPDGNDASLYFNIIHDNSILDQIVVSSPAQSITTNRWHHVAVTYNGNSAVSGVTLYIDGVSQTKTTATDNLTGSTTSSANAYIGVNDASTHPFAGSIDEVRVYNRVLSATEIANQYNQYGIRRESTLRRNGLVGYWSFEDGRGSKATDFSGKRSTGTLTNFALSGSTSNWTTNGKIRSALDFDGSDDYVSLGTAPAALNVGTGDFTWATWIYPTRVNDSYEMIFAHAGANPYLALRDDRLHFYDGAAAAGSLETGTGYISANTWQHVAVTRTSGTIRLYKNGVVYGSTNTQGTAIGSGDPFIGRYGAGGLNFQGKIDEVMVFNRALSATELVDIYEETKLPIKANVSGVGLAGASSLLAWHTFDGPYLNITTSTDRGSGSLHGTLSNTPKPVIGKMGQGLQFDGNDDYVSLGAQSSLDFSGPFSLALWYYHTSTNDAALLSKISGGSFNGYMLWRQGGTNTVQFYINGGSRIASSALTQGRWYHIVASWDGSNVALYIDGVSAGSSAYGSAPSSSGSTFYIGRYGSSYLPGKLDDVRVYSKALSAAEALDLYNQAK